MHYIAALQEAIFQRYGCTSAHVATVGVANVFPGQKAWEGSVEIYETPDHPAAEYCYAWGCREKPQKDEQVLTIITILELPPVMSAAAALERAVADREKPHQHS